MLAEEGARPQRPLWASTGVKDPAYPDTLYVTELVARNTVNTMPEKTLDAVADHGEIRGDTVTTNYADAAAVLDGLAALGVSYQDVVETLESEGVVKFEKSWSELQTERAVAAGRGQGRGVSSTGGAAVELSVVVPDQAAYDEAVQALVGDRVASRLSSQDKTLWGPEAEDEAGKRLSWVGLAQSSRPLLEEIAGLRSRLAAAGADHVVLCGMGGSSLAPEVICATAGVELTVLDSSDPDYVAAALRDRLERTVVVVSSKSGSTVETDSQRRAYEKAFGDAGIDPAGRIVVVTDPGSPLDKEAARRRLRGGERRPGRRGPVLGAHRVRAGAERPGRRRHRRPAGRGGRRWPETCRPTTRATRGCASAPRSAWPRTAGWTSWSWPTPARASTGSATGPSS